REWLLPPAMVATPGLVVRLAQVLVRELERPLAEGKRASLVQPPVSQEVEVRVAEVQPAAAQLEQRQGVLAAAVRLAQLWVPLGLALAELRPELQGAVAAPAVRDRV